MFLVSSSSGVLSGLSFSAFGVLPLGKDVTYMYLSLPYLTRPPTRSPSAGGVSLLRKSFSTRSTGFPNGRMLSGALFLLIGSLTLLTTSLTL